MDLGRGNIKIELFLIFNKNIKMSNQNGMMSLLCKKNSIRYVEKKFLKECQYLKDATIFKRLFNLDENTPFGEN